MSRNSQQNKELFIDFAIMKPAHCERALLILHSQTVWESDGQNLDLAVYGGQPDLFHRVCIV